MRPRTEDRKDFLAELWITAMDSSGEGGFTEIDSTYQLGTDPEKWMSRIVYHDDPFSIVHIVGISTMSQGLAVIRSAILAESDEWRLNADTGQRIGYGGQRRVRLLRADHTNGRKGSYGVTDALAVLQCALFGKVVYH